MNEDFIKGKNKQVFVKSICEVADGYISQCGVFPSQFLKTKLALTIFLKNYVMVGDLFGYFSQ